MLGTARGKTAGYNSIEPDWLLFLSFQAYGSLVVLICAVWFVDALYLISLFCVGDSGEAIGWWYRRRLNGYYKTNKGYTRISSGGYSNVANEDDSDDNDNLEADDENDDIMEQEREKGKYLTENRREARQRLVLVVIFYAVWTGLSACKLRTNDLLHYLYNIKESFRSTGITMSLSLLSFLRRLCLQS
jgi:hypothetical protein